MAAVDGAGLPVAIGIASASPHEVKVLEATLDDSLLDELPERCIGDKAYDSDKLDERLWRERGVKLIAPHRRGRKRPATQDGRELRRYKRRWKVERFFAWLHCSRRPEPSPRFTNQRRMRLLGCLVREVMSLILLEK